MRSAKRVLPLVGAGAACVGMALTALPADAAPASNAYGYAQFHADGVRIHSCASQSCLVRGLGYRSHSVNWYCYQQTGGWIHIHDNTTNIDGWASASLMYYGCD